LRPLLFSFAHTAPLPARSTLFPYTTLFRSRSIGESWERFSLGPTGIVNMISSAMEEKLARIEGGLAHYDYKLRLNAKEYPARTRSEEHTSELQSVRTSYAVFCLKKKTNNNI